MELHTICDGFSGTDPDAIDFFWNIELHSYRVTNNCYNYITIEISNKTRYFDSWATDFQMRVKFGIINRNTPLIFESLIERSISVEKFVHFFLFWILKTETFSFQGFLFLLGLESVCSSRKTAVKPVWHSISLSSFIFNILASVFRPRVLKTLNHGSQLWFLKSSFFL